MAKRLAAMAVVVLAFMALALPAQAKGEGGVITIKNGGSGPGGLPGGGGGTGGGGSAGGGGGSSVALLSSPIRIAGERSAFWFGETGFGQAKWDRPMAFGDYLSPGQLGPSLQVTASFLCGPGNRHSITQVLYPYAKGGPQIYTPAGQFMCGMNLKKGWWMDNYGQMFDTLVAHGLPRTLPATFRHTPAAGSAANSAAAGEPAGSGHLAWPLVLAAVAALGGLILSNAVVARRRARLPA
jgi:hypothetical protein